MRNAARYLLTRLRFYLIVALVYSLAACPLEPVAAQNRVFQSQNRTPPGGTTPSNLMEVV